MSNMKSGKGFKKQENQFYLWCFTFNNYEQKDLTMMRLWLDNNCKTYVFQEETGEKGTKHLQGSISLSGKMRLTELKKIDSRIHWETTRNVVAAEKYACKEETRTGEIYRKTEKKRLFIRSMSKFDSIEPRKEVMEILEKEPDNRTINWIWSSKGGLGKTSTAAYLERNFEGVCIVNGKGADIKNSVIKHLDGEVGCAKKELDVVIVPVPRCNENYVSYAALEDIKDGLIYSGKYEGGFANIEHPHVVVMSNFYPDVSQLSEDRWNIICLDDVAEIEELEEVDDN